MIDNLVTVNQILEIDKTILTNSKKFKNKNILIMKSVYNQYDLLLYKKHFLILFNDFKKVYNYNSALENPETLITTKYDTNIISSNKQISNPVANYIDNIVDDYIKVTRLYNATVRLSYKLTYDESIYFINTFLTGRNENQIADILGITKPSLDKYKKSCLFKMLVNLSDFLDNDY